MAIGKARATPDPLLKVMSDNQSVEVLSSEAHFDDILNVPVVEGAIDGRDAMMTSTHIRKTHAAVRVNIRIKRTDP